MAPVSYRSLVRAIATAREAIARASAPPLVRGRPPENRTELHQAARGKAGGCILAAGSLRICRDADDATDALRAEAEDLLKGLVTAESEARKAARAIGAY